MVDAVDLAGTAENCGVPKDMIKDALEGRGQSGTYAQRRPTGPAPKTATESPVWKPE